jgi:hypothetical protein
MGYLSLVEIERSVDDLARLIGAPRDELPTYGYSRDSAYPHIEQDMSGYHYVIVERGQERERRTTKDIQELLYWVFEAVTSSMSFRYEARNRQEGKDCRRMAFKMQEELMTALNPLWGDAIRSEHAQLLESYPYDD